MSDPARAHNLTAVSALLDGGPFPVRAAAASEVLAAVDLDLVTPGGPLRVRLEPNDPRRPAFARSASLAISHLDGGDGAPLSAAQIAALRAFARHVAARDRGGVLLREPARPRAREAHGAEPFTAGQGARGAEPFAAGQGARGAEPFAAGQGAQAAAPFPAGDGPSGAGRALPLLGDGAEAVSWSRDLFDRNLARIRKEDGPFVSAVLVVVQPCEMRCRFCPSGDVARAVPPGLAPEQQYADLHHQLAAARSLGVDTVEIGGNDVLLFPGVIGLFHAAGRMGFRRISAQSPGQRLADPRFAAEVAQSPLDQVDLPIYGATAEEHERVTRTPGSFDGLCRAVDQALSLGRPRVELHTIALRSTLDRLDALLDFGRRRFGLDIRVELLRPNRVGEREHLSDAASLAEIGAAGRRHPACFGGDIPLCALPPDRARALLAERTARGPFGRRLHLWDLGLREGSEDAAVKRDRSAVYPSACSQCTFRPGCPGVLQAYLDRFGEGDLAPAR